MYVCGVVNVGSGQVYVIIRFPFKITILYFVAIVKHSIVTASS